MDSLREFDSSVVILSSRATKNLLISSIYSSCARPGRLRGSRFQREPAPGARVETLASALPHQRNSRNVGHACHNCHSERSGSTNAASAEAACGLCLARRRKTNEVQSNICIVSIQILRRSAPQNDKLLNCSQAPQQTGMYSWRQRSWERGIVVDRQAKVRIANLPL